jgi:Family of unknown function (DUF5906)
VYGTFLSFVLQTEERKVMMAMRESFIQLGFSVDVLCYDGVMIRKGQEGFNSQILKEVESYINEKEGYNVSLVEKIMTSYDVPNQSSEIAPKVPRDAYLERKSQFEENHFYYIPTNTIAEFKNDKLSFYDIKHAKTYLIEYDFKHSSALKDKTSFIDLWLNDDTRRSITQIDQKPSDDPTVYSPPLIFQYQKTQESCDEKTVTEVISTFSEFITILSGHNASIAEYMLNWISHLLQKPFENPLTCIILSGQKGCGKDTLGDFLQNWVIGNTYCHNYTSTAQFWDKHDCDRINKFLIKLEEASGYINKQHIGDMKARITSHTLTINPKGQGSITTPNYNRFILTTNEGDSVKTEQGERRFFTIACGNDWVGKIEKWESFRRLLFCKTGGKVIGDWLFQRNIDTFRTTQFPQNDYMNQLIDHSKSSVDLFIESLEKGTSYSATEFWNAYQFYVQENDLIGLDNLTKFGRALLVPIRDNIIQKQKGRNANYYVKM